MVTAKKAISNLVEQLPKLDLADSFSTVDESNVRWLKSTNLFVDVENETRAIARYIRVSPIKARRVVDQIRGKSYRDALIILEFMSYRACEPVLKTLRSAVANAEHNAGLNPEQLIVSQTYVDQGPVLKRYRPRAQGRAYPIRKPTCHITVKVAPIIQINNSLIFSNLYGDINIDPKNEELKIGKQDKPDYNPGLEKIFYSTSVSVIPEEMTKIDTYLIYRLGLDDSIEHRQLREKIYKEKLDEIILNLIVTLKQDEDEIQKQEGSDERNESDDVKKLEDFLESLKKISEYEYITRVGSILYCRGNSSLVKRLATSNYVRYIEADMENGTDKASLVS